MEQNRNEYERPSCIPATYEQIYEKALESLKEAEEAWIRSGPAVMHLHRMASGVYTGAVYGSDGKQMWVISHMSSAEKAAKVAALFGSSG